MRRIDLEKHVARHKIDVERHGWTVRRTQISYDESALSSSTAMIIAA